MKTISVGDAMSVSRLAYGCWRIAGTWNADEVTATGAEAGVRAVIAAYEAGYTLFDHADIYCGGMAETIFGRALKEVSGLKSRAVIATKCGIRKPGEPKPDSPYRYDFSRDYIIHSCEQSLQRLGVERIDIYQLHRPDYLMDPAEVAGAFDQLRRAGKVREFGVSNFRPSQLAALQKACPMRLLVNQVEISLANLHALEDGTLDQCLAEKVTPMAWSPLGGGLLGDGAKRLLPAQETYRPQAIVTALDRIAAARGVSRSVVALAWLLRHPAGIIPIIGSADPANIRDASRAVELTLTRDEWYQLLAAARAERLP